jgi:hypothetical protein
MTQPSLSNGASHDNGMLTMGRNRKMTTRRVALSIAQSSTYCHRRRKSHGLLKYFTGLLKHEWCTTYWTCGACCGTPYFVGMRRSWLFRKRKSLKLSCIKWSISFTVLVQFPCYNKTAEFCWSKVEASTSFLWPPFTVFYSSTREEAHPPRLMTCITLKQNVPSWVNPLGCADHVSCRFYSNAMVSQVVSYLTATFVVKINGSTDLDETYFGCKERT